VENGSYLTVTSPTKRATYCCEPSAAFVVPRMVWGFAAVCEHSATALNYESVVPGPDPCLPSPPRRSPKRGRSHATLSGRTSHTVLLHPKNNFLMPL